MVIVFYIIPLIRKIILLESQDREVVSPSKLKLDLMIDDDRRITGELKSSLQPQCNFFCSVFYEGSNLTMNKREERASSIIIQWNQ